MEANSISTENIIGLRNPREALTQPGIATAPDPSGNVVTPKTLHDTLATRHADSK